MARPKRKATPAEEPPAKKARQPQSDSKGSSSSSAAPPAKRGRGRPRKYPASTRPPKPVRTGRGRGRPRKVPKDDSPPPPPPKVEKKKPATTNSSTTTTTTGKPRGRPRKYPQEPSPQQSSDANGAEESSADGNQKDSESADNKESSSDGVEAGSSDESEKQDGSDNNDDEEEEDEDEDEADGRSYWLMKAEPESHVEKGVDLKFSIDDLRASTKPQPWDGVRNVLARNNLRSMKKGDYAFFYHSNCRVPGIVGLMEIVREHSVDETAFNPSHPYYDEKSSRKDPKWDVVHVEFRSKFKKPVTLGELKSHAKPGGALEDLQTLKQSRLSVSAVTSKQWKFIMSLAEQEDEASEDSESSEE